MDNSFKILFLLLSVCISPIYSQNFLQQGNQWIFEYDVYDILPDPLVSQTIETITVGIDTSINNLTYSKLTASLPAPCGIFNETEFLREEGSKIFRLSHDYNQEFLMIDFGETSEYEILYETGGGEIDTGIAIVDSFGIELSNDGKENEVQYLRILNNQSFDDGTQFKVYKNIGFVQYGLLFPYLGIGLCDVMEGIQLRCHISEQDTIHFMDIGCYESSIVSATREIEIEKINLNPNPTTDIINIPTNLRLKEIVNLSGQMQPVNAEENKLNLSGFQNGLYILKFTSTDGQEVYVGKIIKM